MDKRIVLSQNIKLFDEAGYEMYIRLLNVGVLNAATFIANSPEPDTLPFWLPSRVPVKGVVFEVSVYQLEMSLMYVESLSVTSLKYSSWICADSWGCIVAIPAHIGRNAEFLMYESNFFMGQ